MDEGILHTPRPKRRRGRGSTLATIATIGVLIVMAYVVVMMAARVVLDMGTRLTKLIR